MEFKKAQRGVPGNAYETVSAFSNTAGGYLVFGVKNTDGEIEIVGVMDVDKVQNDFLSCLRTGDKLNRIITSREDSIEHEGKTLLVFYIPEVRRYEKPIYLNGDIRKSFIRRGAGDERCTTAEIERFLRDSSGATFDSETLHDFDVEECFDESSVTWYRRLLQQHQGDRHADLSNVEFLHEWGFIIEIDNSLLPTRAALLLFGRARHIHRILPRGIVDFQRIDTLFNDWSPDKRWHDRIVIEENILSAWQTLVEKYMRLAERPFTVNATTLRRHDDPPDYIAFREAAINLLIHQDYGDFTRKPVIKIFSDQTMFWNPGDAFATEDQLLEPIEKEVRNPAIVGAFRRIGLSDQAGTGIRALISNWRQLGYVPPKIKNDKAEKTFEVLLLKEDLLTEPQRLFQAQLGVQLSEQEAAIFAYTCREGVITLTNVKAVIGKGSHDALEVISRLVTQKLLKVMETDACWELAPHLKDRFLESDQPLANDRDLVTDQPAEHTDSLVTPMLTELTDHQRRILLLCEAPRKQADLMKELGLTHRTFFRRKHLEPLIKANLIRMTHPEEPNHPDQTYVVTDSALDVLESFINTNKEGEGE